MQVNRKTEVFVFFFFILLFYLLYLEYLEFEKYRHLLESQREVLFQISEYNQTLKKELVVLQEKFQGLEKTYTLEPDHIRPKYVSHDEICLLSFACCFLVGCVLSLFFE